MVWRVFALKWCAWSKICPMVTSITSWVLGVKSRLEFGGTMPPVRVMSFLKVSFIPVREAGFVTCSRDSAFVGNFGEFLSEFCVCCFFSALTSGNFVFFSVFSLPSEIFFRCLLRI